MYCDMHKLISGSVRNCTFTSNRVGGSGGGLFQNTFRGDVATCMFTTNSARSGGAIYQNAATGMTSNSTFTGNGAERGGAIYQVCHLSLTCHDMSLTCHDVSLTCDDLYFFSSYPRLYKCQDHARECSSDFGVPDAEQLSGR